MEILSNDNVYILITTFVHNLDANLFLSRVEEQIKRVRSEMESAGNRNGLFTVFTSSKDKDSMYLDQMEELKIWFIRAIQNTDLTYMDGSIDPVSFISHKVLERERVPPYRPRYPYLVWMMCKMESNIREIFGETFCSSMEKMVNSNGLSTWLIGDE